MIELTNAERKTLSAAANSINPVVQIGQSGLTEGVVGKVKESLEAHELIKVKFLEFKDEKKEITEQLLEKTNATLVRIIGNVAIIYKKSDDEEKRKFNI